MGNSNAKKPAAQGTDFKQNQARKRRQTDDGNGDDIPIIPYIKIKKIQEGVHTIVGNSIWMTNYKRAFRGYLRRKPERSQQGTQLRIHDQAVTCADELGLEKDSKDNLICQLVDEVGLLWYEDALEFLKDRRKVSDNDDVNTERKIVNASMETVFMQMVHDYVTTVGKKMYDKYSRGADAEVSDVELDEEKKRKIAEQRTEAIRKAAEERERQALEWQKEGEMEAMIHEARRQDLEKLRQDQKKVIDHNLL